jgi:hypothetical protein
MGCGDTPPFEGPRAMTRSCFVFAVAGARHVAAVDVALDYLKRVTRHDIVVVQARSQRRAAHDQVITVEIPAELDEHQASIDLKTNLLTHVRGLADRFCYLDSDVIATDAGVDRVFDHREVPVAFAADHADIDAFSTWAVDCGCKAPRCNHLREALLCAFGVDVRDCSWRLWNGGVFVFDESAAEFFSTWNAMCRQIRRDPYWRTRDQGTLAGAAWKLGLQGAPVLPAEFNFIVDCMRGVARADRASLAPSQSFVRTDYDLAGANAPHFIHFVNGGVGRRGWRNWDDVERLIALKQVA